MPALMEPPKIIYFIPSYLKTPSYINAEENDEQKTGISLLLENALCQYVQDAFIFPNGLFFENKDPFAEITFVNDGHIYECGLLFTISRKSKRDESGIIYSYNVMISNSFPYFKSPLLTKDKFHEKVSRLEGFIAVQDYDGAYNNSQRGLSLGYNSGFSRVWTVPILKEGSVDYDNGPPAETSGITLVSSYNENFDEVLGLVQYTADIFNAIIPGKKLKEEIVAIMDNLARENNSLFY